MGKKETKLDEQESKEEQLRTTAMKEKFLEAYPKKIFNVTLTCKDIGIVRATFYNWLNSDPDFEAAIRAAHETKKDFIESKLLQLIDGNNVAAIIFACKCLLKDRGYVERQELTVGLGGEENVHVLLPDNFRDGNEKRLPAVLDGEAEEVDENEEGKEEG